jgi:succinyl-CoA synthetase alpha subunit
VLVQGITGREGRARAALMKEYGTQVIAGVTPGKGGGDVDGVPVFDTVKEAWEEVGEIDVSVIFVPAPLVKNAALEAFEAGVKLLLLVPDRVPIYDVLEIAESAKRNGAKFVGPNTLGVLSPEKAVIGMIGGRAVSAREWFIPGPVGIISRSGGITSSIAYYLGQEGIGATTLVHVGGDVVVGLPIPQVALLFEADPETKAIVIFGEIGGSQEEKLADLVETGKITKPIIAFIGGKAAKSGTRFSHAGAIVEGNRGTHEGKVTRLREVGATVVDAFGELPKAAQSVLKDHGIL